MTREDFEQLEAVGALLQEFEPCGLLSPLPRRARRSPWRLSTLTELNVFPNARSLSRNDWNLDESGPEDFSLLVAANVFMYAEDPERWFANVLARCRYFVLLDLVRRRRRADRELGPDGDRMRYAIGAERPRIEDVYDLDGLGPRLLGYRAYPGGSNEFDPEPVHVIALIRGDLPTDVASERHALAAIEALSAAR